MVWRVPGLTQLNQTYALDVLGAILGYGRTSRLVRDLQEERGLVSHISVSNMTQRLQGTFYFSSVASGKFCRQWKPRSRNTSALSRQNRLQRQSLPVCGRKLRTGLFWQ